MKEIEPKNLPLRQWMDCDPEIDETVTFYSRHFGGRRVVIIPKERLELSETPTTYVLTFKE